MSVSRGSYTNGGNGSNGSGHVTAAALLPSIHEGREVHAISSTDSIHRNQLRDVLAFLRRRGWAIAICAVVVPIAAFLYAKGEHRQYQASAEVYLSPQNLADALTGAPNSNLYTADPSRVPNTQAQIARSPNVAALAATAVPTFKGGATALLQSSAVQVNVGTDILTFEVTQPTRALAERLATAYANAFIAFRHRLDTGAVAAARNEVERRLAGAPRNSALYAQLADRLQQLETLEALQTGNASLVESASPAAQVRPRPTRNALIGIIVGLGLGIMAALVLEALDNRVRDPDEVEEILGLPILGYVPEMTRRDGDARPLFAPSGSIEQQAFQLLRPTVSFALRQKAGLIMVTSALPGEGKTTTTANLAMAFARARHRVMLVDFDSRKPRLTTASGLPTTPGLAEVLLDDVPLADALVPMSAEGDDEKGQHVELDLLPPGMHSPHVADLPSFEGFPRILEEARRHGDVVLFDAPPLLQVSDAMSLMPHVDGVVLIARLRIVTRSALRELARVASTSGANVLGVVVVGGRHSGRSYGYGRGYRYGYGYGYGEDSNEGQRRRFRRVRRSAAPA